jgi:hypothetical protein
LLAEQRLNTPPFQKEMPSLKGRDRQSVFEEGAVQIQNKDSILKPHSSLEPADHDFKMSIISTSESIHSQRGMCTDRQVMSIIETMASTNEDELLKVEYSEEMDK